MKTLFLFFSFLISLSSHANPVVRLGDEVVFDAPSILKGKRIGILAHYASRQSDGTHIVDALAKRKDLRVKMIFSPEHGFRDLGDTAIKDSIDPQTGIQIYSLYGPRKAPTLKMLSQIDLVLVDLQDVGLRYYTYPATLTYLLKVAKQAHKPVYVLDRPNPIGADIVDGAVLDSSLANGDLTTVAEIPTRTGMTLGEIAIYLNREMKIQADLHVVKMSGYIRAMHWGDTGLKWFPSSPALMNPMQVELYALFGTLESANLAVGRGQENSHAFYRYGTPELTQNQVEHLIEQFQLPGLKFNYVEWTPDRSKYMGQTCRGFEVTITNLSEVQSLKSLIEVSKGLQAEVGTPLNFKNTLSMLGSHSLLDGILNQSSTEEMISSIEPAKLLFLEKRREVLLYE